MANILKEYLKNCTEVVHTTFNPNGPGNVRVHLIPPKKPNPKLIWVVILNGQDVLPINTSWAILLKEFITNLNDYDGVELSDSEIDEIILNTITSVKKVFPKTPQELLKSDLQEIVETLIDIAQGKTPSTKIGFMTLAKYGKYMKAPHRMDLMISAMVKNNEWNCNQRCLHCYAKGQELANVEELTTEDWYKIIDKCRQEGISQVTFTGGEPTKRTDLSLLVDHAKWFVTRLNTNGILLTKELCEELKNASLDAVQVTLYSNNPDIHNLLVGANHFYDTVEGIKNAVSAGLNISINTPLCTINSDYLATVKFAASLGVHYFSASGLILTGGAMSDASKNARLTNDEITNIIKDTKAYMDENKLELSFTSPGWIKEEDLKKLNMVVPSCGACLSNMAVAPNGDVIPCQSWLSDKPLGNMLVDKFSDIWNSGQAKKIRNKSMREVQVCQLGKDKR